MRLQLSLEHLQSASSQLQRTRCSQLSQRLELQVIELKLQSLSSELRVLANFVRCSEPGRGRSAQSASATSLSLTESPHARTPDYTPRQGG
jgi:hypothetical protein